MSLYQKTKKGRSLDQQTFSVILLQSILVKGKSGVLFRPIGQCSQRRIILGSVQNKRSRRRLLCRRIMGGILLMIATWLRKTKKSKTQRSLASKSSSSSIASQSSSKTSSISTSASSCNSTLESVLQLPLLPVHPLDFADFKIYDEGAWFTSLPEDDGLYEIIDVKPYQPLPQLPGVLV